MLSSMDSLQFVTDLELHVTWRFEIFDLLRRCTRAALLGVLVEESALCSQGLNLSKNSFFQFHSHGFVVM